MPKNLIKKYLPDPEKIRNHKSLGFLGEILHEPNLWHLNRHCVAKAFAIGMFWCLIPMPFQMLVSAFFAVRFNANLAISVALAWLSNPITMAPLLYTQYMIGSWILGLDPLDFNPEPSIEWFKTQFLEIGAPLYCGAFLSAAGMAAASYLLIDGLWKRSARKRWAERQAQRRAR